MDDGGDERGAKGALLRLIELERDIEAEVAAAEAEASRILESAQAQARALDQDGGALESELAALRASIARECDDAIARLEAAAQAEARRFREVDEANVRELGHWLAAQVVGGRARK